MVDTPISPQPMDVNALPSIVETKRTLLGTEKSFPCRVLERTPDALVVLFISPRAYQVAELQLPAGTLTFGHFWVERPYNVYHWLTPGGATLAHYFNLADQTVIGADHFSFRDLTLDLLSRPGRPPEVLDHHELPADLDPATHASITRALAQVQAELPQLGPWLEQRADQLWLRLFGAPRR